MKALNALATIPMFILWNVHRLLCFGLFIPTNSYKDFLINDRGIFASTWVTIISAIFISLHCFVSLWLSIVMTTFIFVVIVLVVSLFLKYGSTKRK